MQSVLLKQIELSHEICTDFIDKYSKRFPGLESDRFEQLLPIVYKHYRPTLFEGFLLHFDLHSENFCRRVSQQFNCSPDLFSVLQAMLKYNIGQVEVDWSKLVNIDVMLNCIDDKVPHGFFARKIEHFTLVSKNEEKLEKLAKATRFTVIETGDSVNIETAKLMPFFDLEKRVCSFQSKVAIDVLADSKLHQSVLGNSAFFRPDQSLIADMHAQGASKSFIDGTLGKK